ncbi:MAG: RHS repeat-associated core domain-containing protein [Phycisphaerales bacterium]|nr:RHS repeat-associated core domain-containing protein [Phycisphaerales bacterium]
MGLVKRNKDVVTNSAAFSIPSGTMGGSTHDAEYYVRDAGGNILASYRVHYNELSSPEMISYPMLNDTFALTEHHLYGSSRIGVQRYDSSSLYNSSGLTDASFAPPPVPPPTPPVPPPTPTIPVTGLSSHIAWYSYPYADLIQASNTEPYGSTGNTDFGTWQVSRTLGRKYYEMTDHLGNVLATVLDRRTGAFPSSGGAGVLYDHWSADLASTADCYPGGMMMPGRNTEYSWSRMGYNGKQKDDEVYGKGNFQDYGFRMLDNRIMRFISEDPLTKKYPMLTPFQFASNSPIRASDLDGLEADYGYFFRSMWGQAGITQQTEVDINNTVAKYSVDPNSKVGKASNGTVNLVMGTVGAIGSGIYIYGSGGSGAVVGGTTALTLSFAEMGLGAGQIADAFSNDGQNKNLQASSTLVGYTMRQNNMSGADGVDAVVQFIPGMLTGGNIKSLLNAPRSISEAKSFMRGTFEAASAVDAGQDTWGLIQAAQTTTLSIYDKYKSSTNTSSSSNSSSAKKMSSTEVNKVKTFVEKLKATSKNSD